MSVFAYVVEPVGTAKNASGEESPYYIQCALVTTKNINHIIQPLMDSYRKRQGFDVYYPSEQSEVRNGSAGIDFLNELDKQTDMEWGFIYNLIEKEYATTTFFADMFILNNKNEAVEGVWRTVDAYRHILYMHLYHLLSNEEHLAVSKALKSADRDALVAVGKLIQEKAKMQDEFQTKEVIIKGLDFAFENIDALNLNHDSLFQYSSLEAYSTIELHKSINEFASQFNTRVEKIFFEKSSSAGGMLKYLMDHASPEEAIEFREPMFSDVNRFTEVFINFISNGYKYEAGEEVLTRLDNKSQGIEISQLLSKDVLEMDNR